VERALTLVEDILLREETLYAIGDLIHNRREIERLEGMGLHMISPGTMTEFSVAGTDSQAGFLVRCHGEIPSVITQARDCGFHIVDATCPIVKHSQEIVDQHRRDGWGIIIAAGGTDHPEVVGLMNRAEGNGVVITSREEAETIDFEERSLLLAQTTVDPALFDEVRHILSQRLSRLKINDTTCRFIRKRRKEILQFASQQEVILLVGGKASANCGLLHATACDVNANTFRVESPGDVDKTWLKNKTRIGISGGASTPKWQLEEMKSYVGNHHVEENPKGLKNRKGGTFLWRMFKKQNTKK